MTGSDDLVVDSERTIPHGRLHAVDAEGRAACTAQRPRYTFPARAWRDAEGASCPACARVLAAPVTVSVAYPRDADAADSHASV